MKSIILAGGLGSRLGEITNKIPKSLVRVGSKPVLDYQIELLARHGVKEIFILTGYHSKQIHEYCGDGSRWGVHVQCIEEVGPAGTAGALRGAEALLADEAFLVMSGDIITNLNIKNLILWHETKENSHATFVLQNVPYRFDADFVELDEASVVRRVFLRPHTNNQIVKPMGIASVYIFSNKIFSFIPKHGKFDIERDILSKLLSANAMVYGYVAKEYMKDIGTPERLQEAQHELHLMRT